MSALESFLAMGGYARFVWPAYAITFAVVVGLLVQTVRSLRQRERELKELQDAQGGRRARRAASGQAQQSSPQSSPSRGKGEDEA